MKQLSTKYEPTHSFNLGQTSTSTIYWLTQTDRVTIDRERAACNSTFAIGGVSCSADSLEVAESFVLRRNICGKNPAHRKSANRYSR